MATSSWGALLSFGLGLGTALLGVAAKYVMDYRLARRRLEMDERAAITSALGNGPGLLRRGRLACLEAVLDAMNDPSAYESGHFAADDALRQRLASIPVPPGVSYAFPQVLPQRLDELLSGIPRP
jgi:hypothetical protein